MGEKTKSQLIFGVGFNFYRNKKWQEKRKLVNILWELLHNRVTSNVLNRIKQLAEWRNANIKENKVADTQAKNLKAYYLPIKFPKLKLFQCCMLNK